MQALGRGSLSIRLLFRPALQQHQNKTPTALTVIAEYTGHSQRHPGHHLLATNWSKNMSSAPTYTAEYLIEKLRKDLEAEHVEIEDLSNCGCGMKFDAILVSPKFEGKPLLQRQRLVNQILAEEMKHIHALTMRTLTPAQWKSEVRPLRMLSIVRYSYKSVRRRNG